MDQISENLQQLQTKSQQDPDNQELANIARMARNSRRNAIQNAKQSYTLFKLQQTSPQDVWKVLRKSKPAHTKAIPPLQGLDSFEDKCQILRTTLFPPPTPGIDIPNLQEPKADLRNSTRNISSSEIRQAIKKCNWNAACGYDKIPYLVIEKAHNC